MRYVTLIAFLILAQSSLAQVESSNVSGKVLDGSDGSAVVGATILLHNVKDTTRSKYGISDTEGFFLIKDAERAFYKMYVQSVGYKTYNRLIRLTGVDADLGSVTLRPDSIMLDAVEVTGDVVPVENKGDTTVYNADAFKVNRDASTTDLVSKMPGIVIDRSGVSANGESVEQVLLDGKRFFGQDPLLSLNTIPAEVVDRVEVFDQQSEQSQFTGFDDGNTVKTMNVVTKDDKKNGKFGNVYGGIGTNDRYKAGATLNSFNGDKRLTILGITNNINQQNFSSEDLAGLGGGSRRGFRGGGGNDNLMIGTQNGITQTHALGVNFNDNWGKRATFEGSYFFNKSDNDNNTESKRETFLGDSTQFYNQTQISGSENGNHRLNARVDYKINEKSRLIIAPSISYQDNQGLENTVGITRNQNDEIINQTINNFTGQNQVYNIANSITFQRKLNKIGRSISFELENRMRSLDRTNVFEGLVLDSLTQYLTDETNNRISPNITYTEPIGATGQLSLSYDFTYNNRDSKRDTYLVDPETEEQTFSEILSNHFESNYSTHVADVSFTNRNFGKFFRFGLSYQNAILDNQQFLPAEGTTKSSFHNLLPMAMGRINLKNGASMFIRYATSTDEPSIEQLQNVIDNSNPLFISLGNPELDQSYSHSLMVRISKPNADKNRSWSNFTRVETTKDYMSNSTEFARKDTVLSGGVIIQKGTQIATPVNLNGYWNAMNNTTWSTTISKLKSNLNTSLTLMYRRLPGITNDELNIANAYTGGLRIGLVSNISEKVDFNVYYNISANKVVNSIQSNTNSSYFTQTTGAQLNWTFGKGFVFRNDTYFERYNGINDEFNTNYVLWNMSVAKKFLKNELGELELSVFDLLGQNQSFTQNINPGFVEEIRTQVLQQYFMLTFTYQIRMFKKGS